MAERGVNSASDRHDACWEPTQNLQLACIQLQHFMHHTVVASKADLPDDVSSKPAYISSCRGALQQTHQTHSSKTTSPHTNIMTKPRLLLPDNNATHSPCTLAEVCSTASYTSSISNTYACRLSKAVLRSGLASKPHASVHGDKSNHCASTRLTSQLSKCLLVMLRSSPGVHRQVPRCHRVHTVRPGCSKVRRQPPDPYTPQHT